jgi:hypothetical protein
MSLYDSNFYCRLILLEAQVYENSQIGASSLACFNSVT